MEDEERDNKETEDSKVETKEQEVNEKTPDAADGKKRHKKKHRHHRHHKKDDGTEEDGAAPRNKHKKKRHRKKDGKKEGEHSKDVTLNDIHQNSDDENNEQCTARLLPATSSGTNSNEPTVQYSKNGAPVINLFTFILISF